VIRRPLHERGLVHLQADGDLLGLVEQLDDRLHAPPDEVVEGQGGQGVDADRVAAQRAVSSSASRPWAWASARGPAGLDARQRGQRVASSPIWPVSRASSTDSAASDSAGLPAPAAEVQVRAGGERIDEQPHGAGLAGGLDEAAEDRLGAVPALDPDRRVPGHADDLGDRREDVAGQEQRHGRVEQRVALVGSARARAASRR
jgi:hypothetical protein